MIRQVWWGCCLLAVSSSTVALADDAGFAKGELLQTRTWTHRDGRQLEGLAVRWDHDSVVIESEGKRYEIALRELDHDDRSLVTNEVVEEARRNAPPASSNYSQGTPSPPPTNYGPQNYTPQVPSMPSYDRERVVSIPLGNPIIDPSRYTNQNASQNSAYEAGRTTGVRIRWGGLASLIIFLVSWLYRKMNG